jgi:transcriptional regulator with XRE-family HTH domain
MPPTVRDDMSVGERIAVWRVYRGMTQEACAGLVGKSLSWWKKVEAGVRRVEKLSDIILVAQVLKVRDLADLTGSLEFPFSVDRGRAHPVLPQLRAALLGAGGVPVCRDRPARTETLRARADEARRMFHGRRMFVADLGRTLPDLVLDATAEQRRAETLAERRACAGLLSEVYMLTTQVLRHAAAFDLAWIAVDRSMSFAQEADDPTLTARAAWQLSGVLKDLGRPEEGLDQCQRALRLLEPLLPDGTDEQVAVWGEVQLQAALMAAHCSDEGTAFRHWDAGDEATRRVPSAFRYPVTMFDRRRA